MNSPVKQEVHDVDNPNDEANNDASEKVELKEEQQQPVRNTSPSKNTRSSAAKVDMAKESYRDIVSSNKKREAEETVTGVEMLEEGSNKKRRT